MKNLLFTIFIFVAPKLFSQACTPAVSINVYSPITSIPCPKFSYTLYASPTNGGTSPTYQWLKNGMDVSHGVSTLVYPEASTTLVNGDVITCIIISNAPCANPLTATANYQVVYIPHILATTLSASPSGTVLPGTSVAFTANIANIHGVLVYYQFYINGMAAPSNITVSPYQSGGATTGVTVSYTPPFLNNGDVVYCTTQIHAAGNPCGDIDTSNKIAATVSGVLPITLTGFSVNASAGAFLLDWVTSSENNSNYFIVQESNDGIAFNNIGKVAAAGNTTTVQQYSYVFHTSSTANGTYYFRLQLLDKDGSFTYSNVKVASMATGLQAMVMPNPAKDVVYLYGENMQQIKLYDAFGKLMLIRNTRQDNTIINVSNLARGIYFVIITNANGDMQTRKVILQ